MSDPVSETSEQDPLAEIDLDAELAELGMSFEEIEAALAVNEARELATVLDEIFDPGDDFEQQMQRRAARRLRDRQSLVAFGELLGLGWQTARVIVKGDSND